MPNNANLKTNRLGPKYILQEKQPVGWNGAGNVE